MLSYALAWEPTGEGDSPEAAVADLRDALTALVAEFGVPDELTLMADEKAGFKVARVTGSHHVMRRPDGRGITVPVHAGRDVARERSAAF